MRELSKLDEELRVLCYKKGRETALELWNELTDRDIVGGSQKIELEFEGTTYQLEINAWWEKSRYYDISLTTKEDEEFHFWKTYTVF